MPVWLALAIPALPLQLAQRTLDPALALALGVVLVDHAEQRPRVLACNEPARRAGVVPGMALAAARARVDPLVWLRHDPADVQHTLQQLMAWAYQFSSRIAPFPPEDGDGLVLEIGASWRLFGHAPQAASRIVQALAALGYRAEAASAVTPAAARLLARAVLAGVACQAQGAVAVPASATGTPAGARPTRARAAPDPGLRARLAPLPVQLLPWDPALTLRLHELGLHRLGQLFALPRTALARRFGSGSLLFLDQLLGDAADPQAGYVPPTGFRARTDLPADLIDVPALLPALEHLLQLLEGFLRAQAIGALALELRIAHGQRQGCSHPPTIAELALALPERDARALLALFRERLDRVSLPHAATALELVLQGFQAWQGHSASLLPGPVPGQQASGRLQLLQTLLARLGEASVFHLQVCDDHRPEHAYGRQVVTAGRHAAGVPMRQGGAAEATPLPDGWRPSLLLHQPRLLAPSLHPATVPRYRGPLCMLAGPERIEAGWWDVTTDQAQTGRDYFVARNPAGQTLWIYREHLPPYRWFLHGFFA